jgi:hypothetical protein
VKSQSGKSNKEEGGNFYPPCPPIPKLNPVLGKVVEKFCVDLYDNDTKSHRFRYTKECLVL